MKLAWQGTLLAIQPRIRLTRSFDERSHTYLGYALRLDGAIGGQRGTANDPRIARDVLRPGEQVPFRDYVRRVLDGGEGQIEALFGAGTFFVWLTAGGSTAATPRFP